MREGTIDGINDDAVMRQIERRRFVAFVDRPDRRVIFELAGRLLVYGKRIRLLELPFPAAAAMSRDSAVLDRADPVFLHQIQKRSRSADEINKQIDPAVNSLFQMLFVPELLREIAHCDVQLFRIHAFVHVESLPNRSCG